jgi:hypothetical protein
VGSRRRTSRKRRKKRRRRRRARRARRGRMLLLKRPLLRMPKFQVRLSEARGIAGANRQQHTAYHYN